MYKIKNKTADPRRLGKKIYGREIVIAPGATVINATPVEENNIWGVEEINEQKKSKKKQIMEDD